MTYTNQQILDRIDKSMDKANKNQTPTLGNKMTDIIYVVILNVRYEGSNMISVHKTLKGANAAARALYDNHNKNGYMEGTGKVLRTRMFHGTVADWSYYVAKDTLED